MTFSTFYDITTMIGRVNIRPERFEMQIMTVVLAAVLLWPSLGFAQEEEAEEAKAPRVTIDAAYAGGGFDRITRFPPSELESGHTYTADGIDLAVRARISDIVSVAGRIERSWLRQGMYFTEYMNGVAKNRRDENDKGFKKGAAAYYEVAGVFQIPRSHGHAAIAGLAASGLDRTWEWKMPEGVYGQSSTDNWLGIAYGMLGNQNAGPVSFDYGVRKYYHLTRSMNGGGSGAEFPASGLDISGSATWKIADRVGLLGGYEFRRFRTEISDNYPFKESHGRHKLVVGSRVWLF